MKEVGRIFFSQSHRHYEQYYTVRSSIEDWGERDKDSFLFRGEIKRKKSPQYSPQKAIALIALFSY
ncbi:hypothetical protein KA005_85780 [bacterium]|nr:hypothetical protein [bacterium]